MTSLLSTALPLLLAFSQPDYQAVTSVPIAINSDCHTGYACTYYDGTKPTHIVVNSILVHPVSIAAVLAHEGEEIRAGWSGSDCGEHEEAGVREGSAFYTWFNKSFGFPELSGSDSMAHQMNQYAMAHPDYKPNGC